MLALKVTVPVACFRKGFAREFWETEELPPPSTCYGFLLAMVGEYDRRRHLGVRICPALLGKATPGQSRETWPERSTVLRTLWRVKFPTLGAPGNARPDYQELLTNVSLGIWVDSSEESSPRPNLEERLAVALDSPDQIARAGGLSLGESTHLVDEVSRLKETDFTTARAYLLAVHGRLSLPVWVDHVGSAGTRYASDGERKSGDLVTMKSGTSPDRELMPKIQAPE